MNKSFTRILFLFLILLPGIIYSQTTLIYFEDFENPDFAVLNLNSGSVGTNTGPNQWIIDTAYSGHGIFPNTITQDSTIGGGGITHTDSNYLHINDINVSAVGNADFDPTMPSDRFTTLGPFCTLGLDSIHFAFYCLCPGNSNSYAQLYYQANGGTWIQIGSNLQGFNKWKYEDISNDAFSNVENLQFGFRWVNGNSTDTVTSVGIDDIKLVGTYDPARYPIHISIPEVFNVPVCQNSSVLIEVTFSAPLCGLGDYQVQLSGPEGNFSNGTVAGNYGLENSDSINFLNVNIPSNTPADTCYQIRIVRTDITPFIVSDTSICFQVEKCPNTITTLQPVVLSIPSDTICVGSVIDVPFLSTGVFVNNTYIAQLSDSTGHFTTPVNIIGKLHSSATFPGPPGTVSGKIVAAEQPIPPGCNYYIRVISTNPADTGSVYGPFCIRDCDIETNNEMDISVCVTPTSGDSIAIPVDINVFDSLAVYAATDSFEVQVLSAMYFNILNTGGLGVTISHSDTSMHIYIPGLDTLLNMGLGTGVFYMRVIATNSSTPWNTLGTLIHLTIGSPNPTPLVVYYLDINTFFLYDIPDTTVCVGSTLFYEELPYNPSSSYAWTLNNNNQWPGQNDGSEDYTGITFNLGDMTDYLSVVETNYGCVGPGSDTVAISVLGTPSVAITGPSQICVGDTLTYSVPLENQTYYTWSASKATVLDTANNNLTVACDSAGSAEVSIHAVGLCGVADGNKSIIVKAYPVINIGNDTTVCQHDTVNLNPTVTGVNTYLWNTGATTKKISITPDSTGAYIIAATVTGTAGCSTSDTVTVFVRDPVMNTVSDSICPKQPIVLNPGIGGASYLWSNGSTTQTITVRDTGTYILSLKLDTAICNTINTYSVKLVYRNPLNNPTDTSVCSNSQISLDAGQPGMIYYWSTNDSTEMIIVHDTGVYTVTILNQNGQCAETRQFDVAGQLPATSVITDSLCPGTDLVLNATVPGYTAYYWSTKDSGQTITVHDSGTYIVTISNKDSVCYALRQYNVVEHQCLLSFPNVVTPNGDGKNDYWYNTDSTFFAVFDVKIFDRWGLLIREYTNSDFKWDGRNSAGNKVSDGVYYYIVSAGSGSDQQHVRGFVEVLDNKQ